MVWMALYKHEEERRMWYTCNEKETPEKANFCNMNNNNNNKLQQSLRSIRNVNNSKMLKVDS